MRTSWRIASGASAVLLGLTCGVGLQAQPSTERVATHIGDLLPAALRSCPGSTAAADAEVERHSLYVPAADGVKLAVDVFLPKNLPAGTKLPTLYYATRYWRAQRGDSVSDYERRWIARGFAIVNADVRGTGASFGQWYIPYSPREARDIGFLAHWIADQPWSDGKVVMTGTSYTATTALMSPAYGAPPIVAIAPKFADFDMYADLVYAGGVVGEALIVKWGEMVRAMDLNQFGRPESKGVRPVDGPDGDAELNAAIEDHKINPWGVDQTAYQVIYKDEPLSQYGGMAIDDAGVFNLQKSIQRSTVPIFGWGSWLDSGIAQGMINRFLTWTNAQLSIIGPWTHGARRDVNVFAHNRDVEPSISAQEQMVYCFLRNYVTDHPQPLAGRTIIYYTMGEDRWKLTHVWPVAGTQQHRLYLDANNSLVTTAPVAVGRDAYKVDFSASAGPANRWATQAGAPDIDYGDRAIPDRKLLVYTGTPLAHDMEVTGQPVITLRVTSTHTDGNFIAYLEDVAPDGRVTYITEGMLRALHRHLSNAPPPYRTTYPYRTYSVHDAALLVPGEPATMTFQLMGTSVLVRAGHAMRLAIAGADSGTFLRIPAKAQGDVTIHVLRGGASPSFIDLPVVPIEDRTPGGR